MVRFLVALLFCVLPGSPAPAAPDEPISEGEIVIPPGQEGLLAEILGRGATFPGGCTFAGGGVEHAVVKGRYECIGGEITVELRHPSRAPATSIRTERFAVVVLSGSPTPELSNALESWIRSHEGAFEWVRLAPPPPPEPPPPPDSSQVPSWLDRLKQSSSALAVAAGLLVLAPLWWILPRLARRLHPVTDRWKLVLRDEWFWAGIVVLVFSSVLRCWVGALNYQQNDNHLEVAAMITKSDWAAPASSACFECSHAKLYHYVLAFAFDKIPLRDMMVGNLLNFVAATALLILFFVFVRGGRWSPQVRFLGFAFISFNAGLVGISSQATNDTFCILFSSLAIFFLDRFLSDVSLKHVAAATLCTILAALSKASGWAVYACGVAVLSFATLMSGPRLRKKHAVATVVFALGFLCVVPLVNPYRENIVHAGTPFVNDAFDVPVMREEVPRPATWMLPVFFTFRYLELLRMPFNEYGIPPPYPLHRESLWSQLYGRMFFLRFDQTIWQNQDPWLLSLGRLCLVFGLLPLAALLVGIGALLRSAWQGVSVRGLRWFGEQHDWHHLLYIGVLLAALIAVVAEYHRLAILVTWMKAIYLFPAILPFFKFFLDGLELLWRRSPRLVTVWMAALIAASITDVGWLIHDLSGGPPR
jgi:hypothetical protein